MIFNWHSLIILLLSCGSIPFMYCAASSYKTKVTLTRNSYDLALPTQQVAVAQQMMEEIIQARDCDVLNAYVQQWKDLDYVRNVNGILELDLPSRDLHCSFDRYRTCLIYKKRLEMCPDDDNRMVDAIKRDIESYIISNKDDFNPKFTTDLLDYIHSPRPAPPVDDDSETATDASTQIPQTFHGGQSSSNNSIQVSSTNNNLHANESSSQLPDKNDTNSSGITSSSSKATTATHTNKISPWQIMAGLGILIPIAALIGYGIGMIVKKLCDKEESEEEEYEEAAF